MSIKKRRTILITASIVIAAAVGLAVLLLARTQWLPLFTAVDSPTAVAIENVLQQEGIDVRFSEDRGVIYVAAEDVDRAWMAVQTSADLAYNRFSFMNAVQSSDFIEITPNLQRHQLLLAREAEIRATLMRLEGVIDADVQIGASFCEEGGLEWATAVVTIRTENDAHDIARTAALVTSRSVEVMSLNDVTVICSDHMKLLFADGRVLEELSPSNPSNFPGGPLYTGESMTLIERFAHDVLMSSFANLQGSVCFSLVSEEYMLEMDAMEIGKFIHDIPGGPLYGAELSPQMMTMLENDDIRRFVFDIILGMECECDVCI